MSTPTRLATRILQGLLIGIAAAVLTLAIGRFYPGALKAMQAFAATVLDPLGQVFLRLLFFVVIPLVFASLASGVAQLGRLGRLGPLAGRTFALWGVAVLAAFALIATSLHGLSSDSHVVGKPDSTKASDAIAVSRTSRTRENIARSRKNSTTSAAAAYAYAIRVIQVASRTMSVKRCPKVAFQL